MKRKLILTGSIIAALMLALAVGLTWAQGPEPPGEGVQPQGEIGIQALMGTAFTYQGQLKKDGSPYNGTCDFTFSLWNDASGGAQIGAAQTKTGVTVSNGLFTIPDLDFGAGAFQGDARWLQVAVKCAGDTDYITLSPRQKLTPAPYALALPGLWTQQNTTSPNIIGGYSGNSVSDGVVGATISGGGVPGSPNSVTGNYGTIGGGYSNAASGTCTTVGGGRQNTASRDYATIGGGWQNTAGYLATVGGGRQNTATDYATVGGGYVNNAGGTYAAIGGGSGNIADGGYATIGGGWSNTASGTYATIAGGYNITATGQYAAVGGGYNNNASGPSTAVGGGWGNTASGNAATIGGGDGNIASGAYSTIPGGRFAVADHYGEMAYASGRFAAAGDAQTSLYVLRGTTTDDTWKELYLDGSSARITLGPNRTIFFDILIVGRSQAGESGGFRLAGVIEREGTTVRIVETWDTIFERDDDDAWNARVTADSTTLALKIEVRGNTGDNVRWVAMVRTVEVSWGGGVP